MIQSLKELIRTASSGYRVLGAVLLGFIAVGVLYVAWLVLHGKNTGVALTDPHSTDATSAPGAIKKPSPLGSGASDKRDEPAIAPPMAIPPSSELNGGKPLPVLPAGTDNTPWPGQGVRYRAQHKKGFGGCWGELLLGADRLVFTCPENAGKNLTFTLAEINRVDNDGIAASGEKYHFDIPDVAGKRQVRELFTEWLGRTRISEPPR